MSTTASTLPPDPSLVVEMDQTTQPYWEATREGRFSLPRCGDCGRFHMPPSPFCPHCHSTNIGYPALSGRGVIYSYTILHPSPKEPGGRAPDVVGLVEIPDAQGCRLFTRFVDVPPERVAIGLEVELVWQEIAGGFRLARFRPRTA